MSATVKIYRYTGSGPTNTDITSTNTRCNASDNAYTNQTTNSVKVPVTGSFHYSYWAVTSLYATTAPNSIIDTIKWKPTADNLIGSVILTVSQATSYEQATGAIAFNGTLLNTTNYTTLTDNPVEAWANYSSLPLAVAGDGTTTGRCGNYVVMQFRIDENFAAPASTGTMEITWMYDER